jgi:hypothetical protein
VVYYNLITLLKISRRFIKYYSGEQMEMNEMALRGRDEMFTGFWWGNMRKRNDLQDPGVDGRIISKWGFRKWDRVH